MKEEKIYGCGELNLTPRFVTRNKDEMCPLCGKPIRLFTEYETKGILSIERALMKNYLEVKEIINRIFKSCEKLRKTKSRDDLKPNIVDILNALCELERDTVNEWVRTLQQT